MGFLHFRFLDLIDVLIVAYIFYRLFLLIRGTRAAQMLLGLAILISISIVAQWWELSGVKWIISSIKTVWVVAFVIVFQPEIRRALAQLGQNRIFGAFLKERKEETISEVVKAAQRLTETGFGGLIVLEREIGLKNYIETGTKLQAKVSAELLTTIFTPYTPLHDGAVIIRGDSIISAGCILPLTQNPQVDSALGTRHRAALGLSEETDAVSVVVSEEKHTISLAVTGKLITNLDQFTLRKELQKLFKTEESVIIHENE